MWTATLLTALAPLGSPTPAPSPPGTPNFVVVVVDDFGVDLVGAYGESSYAPATPNMDRLAAEGVLFRNFWTSPVCSPSRARLLTGRYSLRTGLGAVVRPGLDVDGLDPDEVIVPEALPGYHSAATGKWQLGDEDQGLSHPLDVGFDHFLGHHFGVAFEPQDERTACGERFDYFHWVLNADGEERCSDVYATTHTTEAARVAVERLPEPWFLYVAYQAPHSPLHAAPFSHDVSLPPGTAEPTELQKGQSMIEALDIELGRLLGTIRTIRPNTWVFLLGDNGTSALLAQGTPEGCFAPEQSKATFFEGGVRVPLLVSGPGVAAGTEIEALCESTDLFATMCELAGVASTAEDSVSLVPYLAGDSTPLKPFVYAEKFTPNGDPADATSWQRAIRDERYKLVRLENIESFYDLKQDPCEQVDLCAGPPACAIELSGPKLARYLSLAAQMDALAAE